MSKLIFRRYLWLVILIFGILVLSIIFSGTRIISYNFGDYSVKVKGIGYNYSNEIDIFDDSFVHQISIDITDEQYDFIVNAYKADESAEKEWVKVNITIDGILINNVGLRLKGNLTLRQTLGNMGGGRGENAVMSEREQIMAENGVESTATSKTPGFLIKFNKYNEGQTYQGLDKIALRIGSDNSLLGELISYKLFEKMGIVAPDVVYSDVNVGTKGHQLYLIAEALDDDYVEKYFPNVDGVLIKAGNSVGFHYEGDEPTLYDDKFELASAKNKYDLGMLIKFLKFCTESTDEEFAKNLSKYLDINSLVGLMVIDDLVGNTDSFAGMGSNYYIFIDSKGIAKFLPWDYNLAFGGMGGGGMAGGNRGTGVWGTESGAILNGSGTEFGTRTFNEQMLEMGELPPNGEIPQFGEFQQPNVGSGQTARGGGRERPTTGTGGFGGFGREGGERAMQGGGMAGGGMGKNLPNDLKTKFMGNEEFLALYNQTLADWKEKIFTDGLADTIVDYYVDVFYSYNDYADLVDKETYDKNVEAVRNFINGKK